MPTYEQTLEHQSSKKIIYSINTLPNHCYAWTAAVSGVSPLVISQAFGINSDDEVKENDVKMVLDSSLANLQASDTSVVGHYFWDLSTTTLHIKPLDGTIVQENFYLAFCDVMWSIDGSVAVVPAATTSKPFHSRIVDPPPLTLASAIGFSSSRERISTGRVTVANPDGFINNWPFEPNGRISFYVINSTFANS